MCFILIYIKQFHSEWCDCRTNTRFRTENIHKHWKAERQTDTVFLHVDSTFCRTWGVRWFCPV